MVTRQNDPKRSSADNTNLSNTATLDALQRSLSDLYTVCGNRPIKAGCTAPDWTGLAPTIGRVFIRLITDVTALYAFVDRVALDGNMFFDVTSTPISDTARVELFERGPMPSERLRPTDPVLAMRNTACLAALHTAIRQDPSQFWIREFAVSREQFSPDDRDDMAASAIYVLSQTLPL